LRFSVIQFFSYDSPAIFLNASATQNASATWYTTMATWYTTTQNAPAFTTQNISAVMVKFFIDVQGANFAYNDYSQQVRVGGTSAENSAWSSLTSVHCLSAQGASGSQPIVITVWRLAGSSSDLYSVDLTSLSTARASNLASTGNFSMTVTVFGVNLGAQWLTSMLTIGQTACEGTGWISVTSVRALASVYK
jgi:hypothetical protein